MNGTYENEEITAEVIALVKTVEGCFQELDTIISNHLENWTIDRLNYVDKMIIRFAVYEMKYTETPYEIIIDEAVRLTKKYTNLDDDKAKSFNNKLLDKIKDSLYQ
jgi:N utilization substance protein B